MEISLKFEALLVMVRKLKCDRIIYKFYVL